MYLDGGRVTLLLLVVASSGIAIPEKALQLDTMPEFELADGQVDAAETKAVDVSRNVTKTEEDHKINPEELPTPEELNRRRKGRPNGRVRPVPLLRVGPIRESDVKALPVYKTGLGGRLPPNHSPSMMFPATLPGFKRAPSVVKPPAVLPYDIYTSSLNNIQQQKLPEAITTEEDENQLRREFHEYLSSHRIEGEEDMLTDESWLFYSLFPNYNRLWNDFRSLRRPAEVEGRHSYRGNSRLNINSGQRCIKNRGFVCGEKRPAFRGTHQRKNAPVQVRFPSVNHIQPPHHRDHHHPYELPSYTTTTTLPTTTEDIFSIHNMAGPPYYDSIPANISFNAHTTYAPTTTTTTSRPTTQRYTTQRYTTQRPTTQRYTTKRPTTKKTTAYYDYTTKIPKATTSRPLNVWTPFTFQPNYPNLEFDVDFDFGFGKKITNNQENSDDKILTTNRNHYTTRPNFTPSKPGYVTPNPNNDYFTPNKPEFFTTEKNYFTTRKPEYNSDYKTDYDYTNNHRLSMEDEKYLPNDTPKHISDNPQIRTDYNEEIIGGTQYERERNIQPYNKFRSSKGHVRYENDNKYEEKNNQYKEGNLENNPENNVYRNNPHDSIYQRDIYEKPVTNNNINFPANIPQTSFIPKSKQPSRKPYVRNTRIQTHNQGILSKPSMVHKPVRKSPAMNPSGRRPTIRMQKFRAPPAAVKHVVANPWILQEDDLEVVGYPGHNPRVITKTTSILTGKRPQQRVKGASQRPRRQQGITQNRQRLQVASVPALRSNQPLPAGRPSGFVMQGRLLPHQRPSVNARRREPPRRNFFGIF